MNNMFMFFPKERKLLNDMNKVGLEFCKHCIMNKQHSQNFDDGFHSFKE